MECVKVGCTNEALPSSNYCRLHQPRAAGTKGRGMTKKKSAKKAAKKAAKKR